MIFRILLSYCFVCPFLTVGVGHASDDVARSQLLAAHCYDCHQGSESAAGLDLEKLNARLKSGFPNSASDFERWVQVFDRVSQGEMPPPKESEPIEGAALKRFTSTTNDWLHSYQSKLHKEAGRVQGRRLTNLQLERTLHDLLGIDIPLETEMPEKAKSDNFSTLASQQSISHFHLEQHLKVVDLALDEAFRRALTPDDYRLRKMSAKDISRTRTRTREPEYIDGAAVVWSGALIFYGRLPATSAPVSGWYRFQFEVAAINNASQNGVCCSVRSGECVSGAPLMAWIDSFEATDQPQVVTVEAWLPQGHMLEIRPADETLKKARFQGGQAEDGEGGRQNVPGIKINWLNMEHVHRGPDDQQIRNLLLGDLKVALAKKSNLENAWSQSQIDCNNPKAKGRVLIEQFAARAFRRPFQNGNSASEPDYNSQFVAIFEDALDSGFTFAQSLRAGYRAILCSARFLYFQEQPGRLDDFAIASRLSYMLWNSLPDDELMRLATEQKLKQPEELKRQVTRMLKTARGVRFMADFANEWLELSEIGFTDPDSRTHPDFDIIVQNSMLAETQHFLQDMLENNRSVRQFAQCDYTYANSRLARFYGLDQLTGHETRKVELEPSAHRGGLLAQGAILKVTANGTNTSPVLRGVWVSRRILGQDIPPPPDNVPAIEPDIRGATTIREQLEKHRSMPECATCHSKIDAPGFALENFDAAGKWREYYPRIQGKSREKGAKIDASYLLADGRKFDGFKDFCQLASEDPASLARNFAQQLLTYGTGAKISFADRREVDAIVRNVANDDYGIRAILDEVITSQIFLTK